MRELSMAASPVEVLRKFYEDGFMKKDIPFIESLLHPETEWWCFGPPGFLTNGYYQKQGGVLRFLANLNATLGDTHKTFQPYLYLPTGNIVTALGLETGTIQQWGVPMAGQKFENYWSHTAEIEDGKIRKFRANYTVIQPGSVPSPLPPTPQRAQ
jgi:ketosteroid isomerase-like protein